MATLSPGLGYRPEDSLLQPSVPKRPEDFLITGGPVGLGSEELEASVAARLASLEDATAAMFGDGDVRFEEILKDIQGSSTPSQRIAEILEDTTSPFLNELGTTIANGLETRDRRLAALQILADNAKLRQDLQSGDLDTALRALRDQYATWMTEAGDDKVRQMVLLRQLTVDALAMKRARLSNTEMAVNYFTEIFGFDDYKDLRDLNGPDIEAGRAYALRNLTELDGLDALDFQVQQVKKAFEAFDDNPLPATRELLGVFAPEDQQSALEAIFLDTLGVAGVPFAGKVMSGGRLVGRYMNNARLLKEANEQVAAAMNRRAATSAKAAKAVGTSKTAAAASATARTEAVLFDPASVPELAAPMVHQTQVEAKIIELKLQPLIDDARLMQETVLTEEQTASLIQRNITKVEEELAQKGAAISKWERVGVNADEITYKAVVKYPGKRGRSQEFKFTVTRGDIPHVDVKDKGAVAWAQRKLISPKAFFSTSDEGQAGLVVKATRVDNQQKRWQSHLADVMQTITKGLSKPEIVNTNILLEAGAKEKKVYTLAEVASASNPLRRPLTAGEMKAYYSYRKTMDLMHPFIESKVLRELAFEGQKSVKVATKFGKGGRTKNVRLIGREATLDKYDSRSVLDGDTGMIVSLDKEGVKALLDAKPNSTLVKLQAPFKTRTGSTDWVILDSKRVSELPKTGVLNYVTGYVPQFTKNANYIGFKVRTTTHNGVSTEVAEVSHVFDDVVDAETWMERQASKKKKGTRYVMLRRDAASKADAVVKSAFKRFERDEFEVNPFGGMYTGARSKNPIYYTSESLQRQFEEPLTALERNLAFVASAIPMNEFRLTLIEQFLKTANKLNALTDPTDWTSKLKRQDNIGQYLGRMQDYIEDLVRVPTESERTYQSVMLNMMEGMDRAIKDDHGWTAFVPNAAKTAARRAFLAGSKTDPWATLRGASFHTLLGAFNPSQLFVQAQSFVNAFALDPVRAPLYLKQFFSLRLAMNGIAKDPTILRQAVKAAGSEEADFLNLVETYERSGLFQSVRSSSDLEAAKFSSYVDHSVVKKVLDTGLIPFREGEHFARMYSFIAARAEWIRKAGGKLPSSKKDLDEIVNETLRRTLILNRTNKAAWQKGPLSIPTQFFQISAKWTEDVFLSLIKGKAGPGKVGGSFTRTEAGMIFFWSFGLYGASAVPFGDNFVLRGVEGLLDMGPGSVSPEAASAWRGGLTDFTAHMLFGAPITAGSRFSQAYGIQQIVERFDLNNPNMATDILYGASGALPDRTIQAIKELAPVAQRLSDLDPSPTDIRTALESLASIPSSGRNVVQGLVIRATREVRNRRGDVIYRIEDDEELSGTVAGKFLGFQPAKLNDYYILKRSVSLAEKDRRVISDTLKAEYAKYLSDLSRADSDAEAEQLRRHWHVRQSVLIEDLTEEERQSVLESFRRGMKRDPKMQETMRKVIEHRLQGTADAGTPLFTSPSISQALESEQGSSSEPEED